MNHADDVAGGLSVHFHERARDGAMVRNCRGVATWNYSCTCTICVCSCRDIDDNQSLR